MAITGVPFTITDWSRVPPSEHRGEMGTSTWRVLEAGPFRVRVVEYRPGYKADHWCGRGHIVYVLEGKIHVDLRNGQRYVLMSGMGFEAGDDEGNPHLVHTETGARVFIVD